jgi:hypothetical protein
MYIWSLQKTSYPPPPPPQPPGGEEKARAYYIPHRERGPGTGRRIRREEADRPGKEKYTSCKLRNHGQGNICTGAVTLILTSAT